MSLSEPVAASVPPVAAGVSAAAAGAAKPDTPPTATVVAVVSLGG